MLPLPENDPTDPETLASWVELSALVVDDGVVSLGNIAEELRDSNLLQDTLPDEENSVDGEPERLAEQLASDVWSVLEQRQRLLGPASPFIFQRRLIKRHERRSKLEAVTAYLTMLLLEAAGKGWYPGLSITAGDNIRMEFELIVAASLSGLGKAQVEIFSTGPKFHERVRKLAASFGLHANERELERFTHPHEKDRQLDLAVRWWSNDPHGGMPYLLVQCATGKNWMHDKAAEPPIETWKKFATWDGPLLKTLAVPYTINRPSGLADAWLRSGQSVIFDRIRLARGAPDARLPKGLGAQLAKWCRAKILCLHLAQSD